MGAGRERAASGDERYGGRQLGAAGEPALPPARGNLEPALRLPAVRRHQCRRLLLYQGARHAHGEHAARGTHSEGPTRSPCSALQRTCSAHCTRSTVVSPSRPMPPTGCRSLQTRASAQRWSPPSSSPRATSAAPRAPDSSWTGTRTTTLPHPPPSCRARHSCHCCHFHQSCALYHSCRFCHPYHSSHS